MPKGAAEHPGKGEGPESLPTPGFQQRSPAFIYLLIGLLATLFAAWIHN